MKIKEVFEESKEKSLKAKKDEFLNDLEKSAKEYCEGKAKDVEESEKLVRNCLSKISEVGQKEKMEGDYSGLAHSLATELMDAKIRLELAKKEKEVADKIFEELF